VIAAKRQARQSRSGSASARRSTARRTTTRASECSGTASGSTGGARQTGRGEGKGYTPSDRPRQAVSRWAETAVPLEWKVVFGYAYAIPASPASQADDVDNGSRSHGRLMVMKPNPWGPGASRAGALVMWRRDDPWPARHGRCECGRQVRR